VSGFWHPLSGVFLENPRALASPRVLKLLLSVGPVVLRYAGDRMWPALEDGRTFEAVPIETRPPRPGTGLVAATGGVVDVWRVVAADAQTVRLVADSDPAEACDLPIGDVLAEIPELASTDVGPGSRCGRRRRLECEERRRAADPDPDPALTVRTKYEAQAAHYAAGSARMITPETARWFAREVPSATRVLVVGSGAGREAVELADAGYWVHGIDFSEAMTDHAIAYGGRCGSAATFECRDLREWRPEDRSFGAAFFTYDVYSFLPSAADRREALARLRDGLGPDGRLFLSARLVFRVRDRRSLAVQHGRAQRAGRSSERGDSHTRFLSPEGRLGRAFVHLFEPLELVEEVESAGWRVIDARPGHLHFHAR